MEDFVIDCNNCGFTFMESDVEDDDFLYCPVCESTDVDYREA